MGSDDLLISGLLERTARRVPDKAALVFGADQRTYRQLDERAARVAAGLSARGVGHGDHVALLLHNGFGFVEALLACAKLGAIAVPVNFRLVGAEITYILDDCGAVGVITGEPLLHLAADAARDARTVGFLVDIDDDAAWAGAPERAPGAAVSERDVALLLYTSGTTGRPKGAMLSHRSLVLATLSWICEMRAGDDDVWLSGQPLFHIGGINGLLPFLTLGATVVLTPSTGFDPDHAVDLLERHAVSMCIFVPTQWDDVCPRVRARGLDPERLRAALWSASPATRATLEDLSRTFPKASIVSAYGQTEMAGATTLLKGPDALPKQGSVGRPMLGIDLRVVDDELADVPVGEIGEVVYQSPTVMRGYHGRPDATAEAFAGGWFHSGDLARLDADGCLWLVDRKKDLIVSGGENIYPAEVERALLEHPGVRDVAVIGVPDPRWVETPLAFVVPADGEPPTPDELQAHCRARLASYKKPSGYLLVDELPRNAAGKVLKRELRDAHLTKGT
jgi:acyl-CoA synthetase (AMP-forming)/AMP-acid ligase II